MVNAAIEGRLDSNQPNPSRVSKYLSPKECPGVPSELLDPRAEKDTAAYDGKAAHLAGLFAKLGDIAPEIGKRQAGRGAPR